MIQTVIIMPEDPVNQHLNAHKNIGSLGSVFRSKGPTFESMQQDLFMM